MEATMQLEEKAHLLRIFIGENDRFGHHALYEAIVLKAREQELAGATVLRGPMGFGHSSRLHTAKSCASPKIFPSLSKLSTASRKSQPFSRYSMRW
jgi:uncharacterized protein